MSIIRIIQGVPWDVTYTHTRLFPNAATQLSYFQSFTPIYTSNDFNFLKMQGKNYLDIPIRFDQIQMANYVYFQNTSVSSKWWYCFITDYQVLNAGTTRVFFERDVMQSWMFDYTLAQSVIEREHVTPGTTRNIIPEDIMAGNEYETVAIQNVRPQNYLTFVMVFKQRIDDDYTQNPNPTFVNNWQTGHPEQLIYYYIPFLQDMSTLTFQDGIFNAGGLMFLLSAFQDVLSSLIVNNIVSMYITDYLPLDPSNSTQMTVGAITFEPFGVGSPMTVNVLMPANNANYMLQSITVNSSIYSSNMITGIDNEKLNYYPFTKIELLDSRGNFKSFKPEGLPTTNNIALQFFGSLSTIQTTFVGINGYNGETDPALVKSRALMNSNPQDLPILTEYLAAFLQGNKNQLENKRQILEQDLIYNQNLATMNNTGAAANRWSKIITGGIGTVASIAKGNTAGAVASINLAAKGIGATTDQIADIMKFERLDQQYQQQIDSIYAKMEDLENKPPSISDGGNNLNLIIGNNLMNYSIVVKRVRPQYIAIAQGYFNQFGFKTMRVGVPVLRTRASWNYWKLAVCNLTTNFYNEDLQMVKMIYEKGITFWHTNAVLDYTQANGLFTD